MVILEDLKLFLRIDEDITDDDQYLEESMLAATIYIEQMTGKPYKNDPLYDRAITYMVAHWYENRDINSTKTFVHDLPYTLTPIIQHIALSQAYLTAKEIEDSKKQIDEVNTHA